MNNADQRRPSLALADASNQKTANTLKIGSFNMQGALSAGKVEALCEWGYMKKMDIIAVQETNMNNGGYQMTKHIRQNYYDMWWVNGKEGATKGTGVGLLMAKSWFQHAARTSACGSRAQARDFNLRGNFKIRIINCYIPSGRDREEEAEVIKEWLKNEHDKAREEGRGVILLGDFNAVRNPRLDRSRENASGTRPESALLQWLETQPLHDVFRAMHPLQEDFTFGNKSRIDMIFVSDIFADRENGGLNFLARPRAVAKYQTKLLCQMQRSHGKRLYSLFP